MKTENSHGVHVPDSWFDHQQLLSKKQVIQIVNLSGSWIDKLIKRGKFPQPMQLTGTKLPWLRLEIAAWVKERAEQARKEKV